MAASKKSYILPLGPGSAFVHAAGTSDALEISPETVDKNFPKLPKSAQEDYTRAGLVAEVPAEIIREMAKPVTEPSQEG